MTPQQLADTYPVSVLLEAYRLGKQREQDEATLAKYLSGLADLGIDVTQGSPCPGNRHMLRCRDKNGLPWVVLPSERRVFPAAILRHVGPGPDLEGHTHGKGWLPMARCTERYGSYRWRLAEPSPTTVTP